MRRVASRHKIPRARYKVANWPAYDKALQQRGSLTVWVAPNALAAWHLPHTGQHDRPRDYVDLAIKTGLKVYGAGEGLVEKHGERGARTWRKLHLAVVPSIGEILASVWTGNRDGDASQVGALLVQIPSPLASVTADGAYDGEPIYQAVAERQPDPPVAVVIPPRSTAVPSSVAGTQPDLCTKSSHHRMLPMRLVAGAQRQKTQQNRAVYVKMLLSGQAVRELASSAGRDSGRCPADGACRVR